MRNLIRRTSIIGRIIGISFSNIIPGTVRRAIPNALYVHVIVSTALLEIAAPGHFKKFVKFIEPEPE